MPFPTPRRREGAVIVLMAIMLTMCLSFFAAVLETSRMFVERNEMQTAADAASLAGINLLARGDTITPLSVAIAIAKKNTVLGHPVVLQPSQVQCAKIDSSGTMTLQDICRATSNAVKVTVNDTSAFQTGRIIAIARINLSTHALSSLYQPPVRNCIFAMKKTGSITLNSSTIRAPYCGLIANGNYTSNSGDMTMAAIGVVGQSNSNSTIYREATPQPADPAPDPCGYLAGCRYLRDNPPATTSCTARNLIVNKTATLVPGVYCSGTTFNSASVTLAPGVYVFSGGLTSNASTITGTGVTIVVPTGAWTLNSGSFNLSAPATGNTLGVLYYQPSTNTSGFTMNSSSSGNGSLNGAMYAPGASLTSNASFGSWFSVTGASITLNSGGINVPTNVAMPGQLMNTALIQ